MLPGRTNSALIQAIIETDINVSCLDPWIDFANELVTEICSHLVLPGTSTPAYNSYRLELIERWLAAHAYTVFDPRLVQESVAGGVMQITQGEIGLALRSSIYGQNAMRLDTQGALAIFDNGLNKYAKIPAAILNGLSIGVTHMGPDPTPFQSRGVPRDDAFQGWW